jgi:hypothetical protein
MIYVLHCVDSLRMTNGLRESGFDEKAYLAANGDVAEAVSAQRIPSGWFHWQTNGRREGRPLAPPAPDIEVDEAAYLQRYPDVADAVRRGSVQSGRHHYIVDGYKEARNPGKFDRVQADLMRRFCSLGEDCELGLAQRHYGAEPLDLLRWAAIPLPVLLHLLTDRFVGIVDPQYIDLRLVGTHRGGEWAAYHRKYNFEWHTYAYADQVSGQQVRHRESVRLARLADKLIEELELGERVFVRWDAMQPEESARATWEAIRRYNPACQLLFVRLADSERTAGTVQVCEPGLCAGFVDRFSDPEHRPTTTSMAIWLRICQEAERIMTGR